jgi:hypothetical protein
MNFSAAFPTTRVLPVPSRVPAAPAAVKNSLATAASHLSRYSQDSVGSDRRAECDWRVRFSAHGLNQMIWIEGSATGEKLIEVERRTA